MGLHVGGREFDTEFNTMIFHKDLYEVIDAVCTNEEKLEVIDGLLKYGFCGYEDYGRYCVSQIVAKDIKIRTYLHSENPIVQKIYDHFIPLIEIDKNKYRDKTNGYIIKKEYIVEPLIEELKHMREAIDDEILYNIYSEILTFKRENNEPITAYEMGIYLTEMVYTIANKVNCDIGKVFETYMKYFFI